MPGLDRIIVDLALILVTAGVTTLIFKKIKQPVVLGYIVAGFLVGSNFRWFPNVYDFEHIHIWAEIGIVFLMFALGLEFSLQKLTKLGGSVVITTLAVVLAMICVGYAVGELMGWSDMDSIFLGGMICISSTMIILKAYEEYNLKGEKFAHLAMGVLIMEDLVAIFIMIILSTLAVSREVSGLSMLFQISILLLYLVLWVVLGIYLIPSALKRFRSLMNDETLLIASIGMCLGMVVIANLTGFSSALGAFVAGSILAGTAMAEKIETIVKPLKDLFGAVFFVSVGLMVVPEMILEHIAPILVISVVVIVGQMFFSGIGALFSGHSLHTAVRLGFSFVQIGEFSFIIATLGSSLRVTSDFLYPIVVCVSVFTTFLTPVMIKNSERAYNIICKILPGSAVSFLDRYTSEKRGDSDRDEDWSTYMSRYLVRTVICSAALFAIYMLTVAMNLISPFIYDYVTHNTWAMVMEFAVVSALMAPFVSIMCSGRKRFIFVKLWLKNATNRLPLLALNGIRVAIALFFIMITFNRIWPVPRWLLLLLAIGVIIFVERTDFAKSAAATMETRFMANFNERHLENTRSKHGAEGGRSGVDELLFVAKFDVCKLPKRDEASEFYKKNPFGIYVSGIYIITINRGGKPLNVPHATDKIKVGDTVFAMGEKQSLGAYLGALEKLGQITNIEDPPVTLREFMGDQAHEGIKPEGKLVCHAVEVPKKSPMIRKTIKNSNFRATYNGYIIGIERGLMPITGFRNNMVIYEGDVLWVLGKEDLTEKLAKDGLLQD
ncbi:MAG: cation:proton antiporter [Clostridiales bacterium]|nr:cation:proton antiporter [Clostridiales bacterium]